MSKKCAKCRSERCLSEFSKNKSRKDGLNGWCKSCMSNYHRQNLEQRRIRDRMRMETDPERYKEQRRSWRQQHADQIKQSKKQWYQNNRDSILQKLKSERITNPELVRSRDRLRTRDRLERRRANSRWRQNNLDKTRDYVRIRRAKIANNSVVVVSAKDLRRLHCGSCSICGVSTGAFDVDHIIPLSRGGRHGIGNLQRLCQFCNRSKGTQFMIEFRYKERNKIINGQGVRSGTL